MLSLFLVMIVFVLFAGFSYWASMLLLANLFKAFNYEDQFTEFYKKTRGVQPSRRRLIANAYGLTNFFSYRSCVGMDDHPTEFD